MRKVLLAVLLAGCATTTPAPTPRVWQTPLPTQDLRGAPLTIRPEDAAACQREAHRVADGSMPADRTAAVGAAAGAFGILGGLVAGAIAGAPPPPTAEEVMAHQERWYRRTLHDCLRARHYFL